MIKAIIFDLNGIFIQNQQISESEKLKREVKIPILEFIERLKKEEIVSETMIVVARELKVKGIKLFLLSNTIKEVAEYYYKQYPVIFEVIDKAYYSFETGFTKPDVRSWENILRENNLLPEECIYFDDQEKHLKAPQSLGIKSFLFTNETDLEDKLKELNITFSNR